MSNFSAIRQASLAIPSDVVLTDIVKLDQLAKFISLAFNVDNSNDQMDDACSSLILPDMPQHSVDALEAGELSPAAFTFFATQWVAGDASSMLPGIDEIEWLSDVPAADQFRELFNADDIEDGAIYRAKDYGHAFIQWIFCDGYNYTPEVANRISAAVNAAQVHIKATAVA